jgi:diguanylate cyclase (GGDEF)-like protein
MASIPLRRRVLYTTLIYSVLLIGIVFILTWRTHGTQREVERVVSRQTEAVETMQKFKVVHAGLEATWTRTAAADLDAFDAAIERYLESASQYRQELTKSPAVPRELVAASEELDRVAAAKRARWPALRPAERVASVEALREQAALVRSMADAAIQSSNQDIERGMKTLVRAGRDTMWTGLGAAWIIAVIGIAVARNALKRVVSPLEELSRAASRIAAEDFEARAPVGGDIEIARLGAAFNEMAEKIQAAVEAREHKARTDDLTKLPNFRAFSEMIGEEIERSTRYGHRFGLLVFDIDHFKTYNDSYGHLAGNEALQLVSSTIRRTLRVVDKAARYGGEEFAAILPEVDEDAMRVIGERARRAVQSLAPIEERRRITVSVGGAIFPEDGRTPYALFQSADKRLYQAKEKGRNMVVTPTQP